MTHTYTPRKVAFTGGRDYDNEAAVSYEPGSKISRSKKNWRAKVPLSYEGKLKYTSKRFLTKEEAEQWAVSWITSLTQTQDQCKKKHYES